MKTVLVDVIITCSNGETGIDKCKLSIVVFHELL